MFISKLVISIFGITSVLSVSGYGDTAGNSQAISPAQTLVREQLAEALTALGVPLSDLMAFKQSGKPPSAIVNAMTTFANNANSAAYSGLTQSQKNALTLFAFVLHKDGKLSSDSLQNLMRDEKIRLGMSLQEVGQLQTLASTLSGDTKHQLTPEELAIIQSVMPKISQDPFAFADVLGLTIGAMLYNSDNGYITPDPILEGELIAAAQEITGLTDGQIDNITNITNNYQTNSSFTPTDENVTDMNQALAVSVLPYGSCLLYPLLGVESVEQVNAITGVYGAAFAGAAYWDDAWAHGGYYNNYNNAASQRQNTVNQREDNVNSAQGQHQGDVNQRQSDASNAQGQHQGNIDQRQGDASSASGQRESTVSGREGNVSGAESARSGGSSLNRDNGGRGGSWGGGGHGGGGHGGGR